MSDDASSTSASPTAAPSSTDAASPSPSGSASPSDSATSPSTPPTTPAALGCSATGDPACDTVIRWTRFRGDARRRFRETLDLDDATWARGAGWTLWKGLIMLTNVTPGEKEFARHVLAEVVAG